MSSLIGPFPKIVSNDGWDFPTRATRRPVRERVINGKTYRLSDPVAPVVTHCRACGVALYDDEIARDAQTCGEQECEEAV